MTFLSQTGRRMAASALALTLGLSPAFAQAVPPAAVPPADGAQALRHGGNQAAAPTTPQTTTTPDQPMTGKVPEAANANAPVAVVPQAAQGQQAAPASFADVVAQVSPAVVNITTTSVVSRPVQAGPSFPEGSPFSDLFRDFGIPGPGGRGGDRSPFGGPMQQERSTALGSGFVISSDGFIVTNNHVIDGADEIEVEFYSGAHLPAKLVGTDPTTDIAVLKVEADKPLPFLKFGDSDAARVGDWVLALGNPLGQGLSASSGIISAKSRALTGTYDDFIQTDAAINRGNSGGPLFNMAGEVVGVNTAILSPNGGSIGIGFSMASNVVSKVADQLRQFGETKRGWLGVKIQDLTPDIANSLGIKADKGALVTDVPAGPAADAGVKAGDVITRFAGGDVSDTRDLVRRVADAPVGEAVDVTVQRGGQPVDLKITLGRRELADAAGDQGDDNGRDQAAPRSDDLLGMTVSRLTPDLADRLRMPEGSKGLVIEDVQAKSDAAAKGLQSGDLIVEAGQQPVGSIADLKAQIAAAKDAGRQSLLLLIRRQGEPRFVALSID